MIGLLTFSVIAWTGYHLWFQPSPMISLTYGIGSLIIVGAVAIAYSRSSAVLVARLEAAKQQREKEVADLLKELSENGLVEAVKQGKRLLESIASFSAVSVKRFNGSGVTLSSYIDAAKDLEASILHNLRELLIAHQSIQAINDSDTNSVPSDTRRKELVELQKSKMGKLSTENQEAITLLSETAVSLSNIDTMSQIDRELTYARLKELAERAKKYVG